MKSQRIPFLKFSPLRPQVKAAVDDVLNSGVLMNGPYLEIFKKSFADYVNIDFIVPTANCTDSLEIILRTLEIKEGDEVITTSFSWFSDASVVQIVGAKVILCDIELEHFGIMLSELRKKIRSKTKAVILPHLFGLVHPQIEEIVALCAEENITLIEDCAQAHGAKLNGKMAGTFGDVAAFSFYPTKNLGALGDAGAITTNNESLAKSCQLWANHGQVTRNEHLQLGRNSRMDEIQAAVLSAKLAFLDTDNLKRKELANIYHAILKDSECSLPIAAPHHVYHQFVIRTDRRGELKEYLISKGIETDIHYPVALSDMNTFHNSECRNATEASKTVLSLPIHPNHSADEIEFVAQSIKAFFKT